MNFGLGTASGLSSRLPPTRSFTTGPGLMSTSTVGVGLRPQVTGGGAANPFRVSAAPLGMGSGFTGQGGFGGAPAPNSTSFQSPSTFGAVGGSSTGFSGSSMFNGGFGAGAFGSFAGGTAGQTSAFGGLGQQTPQSTTVPGTASLI
ncbi:hypothetical protein FISHEDRAFT_62943 [Fistulina hepatica ATCC 64428]|uniref:Uncharacterized protein n=1 Tax=Fistulina hepatica ATCC 64428 TaxID=1128425 RepID=A0A0D6ZZU9_9AGAR|nr:hypothetical protein FISHEDRAFT_62943 [Fistulina hepatica ATCC 64428]